MMGKVDTGPLRQLYDHLGIEPLYVLPSRAAWQLQERDPQEKLPETLTTSIDKVRDLAVMSRNYLQIGALEFSVGLDFLHGGRGAEAVQYFETARRQWLFIDHLPLISLAYFGTGMAYHQAGDYRQAAAAYFKVKQCIHQAETEPHRLETYEAERSLQAFWNDLERWLRQAINSLRSDFSNEQDDFLRAELGETRGEPDNETEQENSEQKASTTLVLRMQPARAMTAADINTLVFKTVDGIEALDRALTTTNTDQKRPRPTIGRLDYSTGDPITVEVTNVTTHTVAFCRWLMTTIPTDERTLDAAREDEEPQSWFTWQVQSGHIAKLVRVFVNSATGTILDEIELERLMEIIGHLAELRLNCQLTVN